MLIEKASIRGYRLEIVLLVSKINDKADQIVLKRRSIGGYEEKEWIYPLQKYGEIKESGEMIISINLRDIHWDGIFWDILYRHKGLFSRDKKLENPRFIQGEKLNPGEKEYILGEHHSLKLSFDKTRGGVFLKNTYDGVVYEDYTGDNHTSIEDYLKNKKKVSCTRYAELEICGDKYVKLSNLGKDLAGGEARIIFAPVKAGKYIEKKAEEVQGGEGYTVDLADLEKLALKKEYKIFFTVEKQGRGYLFNIAVKKRESIVEEISYVYMDANRYLETVELPGKQSADRYLLFLTGVNHDQLSVIAGTKEFCDSKKKGVPRVVTEQMYYHYPYKFSVVMAVYNVEKYLEEAIESVLEQDIGFARNIQLILVDDGSSDSSLDICRKYEVMYPRNIVVIHKANGGAADARNEGKKYATGKYVNFLDSDDKISANTFREVWDFFESNFQKTDVVCIPIFFFGENNESYWQNYKFAEGTRVIDLSQEYTISNMNTAASFIKNHLVKKYEFNKNTPVGEDAKYLLEILLEKQTLGVLDCGCRYDYRRRDFGETSLVTGAKEKKEYYIDYMQNFIMDTLSYAKEKEGYVPLFVQNTLMMDLQWKLLPEKIPQGVLSESEKEWYLDSLKKVLCEIDDRVICKQRKLCLEYEYQILKMKYGSIQRKTALKNYIYHRNDLIIGEAAKTKFVIEFIDVISDVLIIEGYCNLLEDIKRHNVEVYASVAGRLIQCERVNREKKIKNVLGKVCECVPFKFTLKLNKEVLNKEIYFYTSIDGYFVVRHLFRFGKFAPFDPGLKKQYYVKDGYVVFRQGSGYKVIKYSAQKEFEKEYVKELWERRERAVEEKNYLAIKDIDYVLDFRKRHFDKLKKKEKKIWLISDRTHRAGDNGEALFKYLLQLNPEDIDVFFVISENCEDYERMKKMGKVLSFGSEELRMYTMLADVIISSQAEDYIVNPFGTTHRYLKDLREFKFVFLQHGITMNDLSTWLNRYNKNLSLFITSAKAEHDSIVNGAYNYHDGQVVLTGFPRYDLLITDEKPRKSVVFMPTWRKNLASRINAKTGERFYNDAFKESYFYQFYQRLIEEPRILSKMEEKGYTGRFILHPSIISNIDDFKGNHIIEVCCENTNYQKEFKENALLVTDYSSVAFDFAYLRKPVIYTQSDKAEFFENAVYDEGYWDYEKMGFGPVCFDYETTVQAILESLERDCQIEEQYKERIDNFYTSFDQNNCKRVYEEIRRIDP